MGVGIKVVVCCCVLGLQVTIHSIPLQSSAQKDLVDSTNLPPPLRSNSYEHIFRRCVRPFACLTQRGLWQFHNIRICRSVQHSSSSRSVNLALSWGSCANFCR